MERIGKYEVTGTLGRGGMGVVYLGRDPDLNRLVALKVLQESLSNDDSFLRRFEEEARAVAQLFHPHILPINALSREGARLIIEMPYIETGSLADLIAQRGLHCPDAAVYCADTLDALAACHAHGIVHRDVKPSNILLDAQGRALLSDFGLAKALDLPAAVPAGDMTATSVFVGTPRYAPLEAWDGAPPSPAWDLYSVGVILYEGLSGTRLVESDTFLGYVRAMERGTFPRLTEVRQGVSEEMSALVEGLLSPDPAARPETAGQALEKLRSTPEYKHRREGLETTGVRSIPRGVRVRALRATRKRRASRLAALAFVLVSALAIGALALVFSSFFAGSTGESPATPRGGTTAETSQADAPVLAALLGQPRFAPPARALTFAASVAGSPDRRGRFMLVSGPEPGMLRGLLVSGMRVCDLEFEKLETDGFTVTGVWGTFTDASALECAAGEVAGSARWLAEEASLWMALVFTAPNHALRWEEHLTLTRTQQTDTALLWEVEEDDYLAPMLVNELAPREGAWLAAANRWLPALPGARLALGDGKGLGGPQMDALWVDAETAGVPAFPREAGGQLAGLVVDDGVLLRLQAASPAPEGWSLRLALQTGFSIPQRHSKRYAATWRDGAWADGRTVEHERASAWEPPWQTVSLAVPGRWGVEVLLKVEGGALPSDAAPWRLNAALLAPDTEGAAAPVLFWGAPETAETPHGVMLVGPAE